MIALAPPHENEIKIYTDWLEKNNFSYYILNNNEFVANSSMLILCGGIDIGKNKKRDSNEFSWFKQFYGNLPILGICRGMQLANLALGGTIYTDLNKNFDKHTSNKKLISEGKKETISTFHNINYNNRLFEVNSRHHQGIKKLADDLKPIGFSENDNLVEMVIGKQSLFVQWHPERKEIWNTPAEQFVTNWIKLNL